MTKLLTTNTLHLEKRKKKKKGDYEIDGLIMLILSHANITGSLCSLGVEHAFSKRKVTSSILVGGSFFKFFFLIFWSKFGNKAQP